MEENRPNRRQHPRIPFAAKVRFTRGQIPRSCDGEVRIISTHGMEIHTREVVEKGDWLSIELAILNKEEPGRKPLLGEVVWVNPAPHDGGFAVGIYFDNIEKAYPTLYAKIKLLEERLGL